MNSIRIKLATVSIEGETVRIAVAVTDKLFGGGRGVRDMIQLAGLHRILFHDIHWIELVLNTSFIPHTKSSSGKRNVNDRPLVILP